MSEEYCRGCEGILRLMPTIVQFFVPRRFGAFAFAGRIFVRPWLFTNMYFEEDIKHERVHLTQQTIDGSLFYLRYFFSTKWRAFYELQAFCAQTKDTHPDGRTFQENYRLPKKHVSSYNLILKGEEL